MKFRFTQSVVNTLTGVALLGAASLPLVAQADSAITVYFTRHAEKMTELMDLGDGKFMEVCWEVDGERTDDCAEVLNPVGELRAELLADYFDKKNITSKLTHVFSSDKQRTRQTVQVIADRSGLDNDSDLMSADGVQQLPSDIADEFGSNSISVDPTVTALLSLEPGSVALVAAHSGTIYRIFGGQNTDGSGGLGIDTTMDPVAFPKSSSGKVPEFGDLWEVEIKNGRGTLKKRIQLIFEELDKK